LVTIALSFVTKKLEYSNGEDKFSSLSQDLFTMTMTMSQKVLAFDEIWEAGGLFQACSQLCSSRP